MNSTTDLVFDQEDNRFNVRSAALIFKNDCLLLQDDSFASYFYLPGGRVHYNETSAQALLREIREELKMEGKIEKLRFVCESFFFEPTLKKHYHELCFYYEVTLSQDIDDETMIDSSTFYWKEIDKLREVAFQPVELIPYLKDQTFRHLIF